MHAIGNGANTPQRLHLVDLLASTLDVPLSLSSLPVKVILCGPPKCRRAPLKSGPHAKELKDCGAVMPTKRCVCGTVVWILLEEAEHDKSWRANYYHVRNPESFPLCRGLFPN
jgi:hypothetical protein